MKKISIQILFRFNFTCPRDGHYKVTVSIQILFRFNAFIRNMGSGARFGFQYKSCFGLMLWKYETKKKLNWFQYKSCFGLILNLLENLRDLKAFQYKSCFGLILSRKHLSFRPD